MAKALITALIGLLTGVALGYFLLPKPVTVISEPASKTASIVPKKEVLGFLPYWLLGKAQNDYSSYITTLDYFSLTPDVDGTILKYTSPGQSEPGYYALTGGKVDSFIQNAKSKNIKLSLTVFDGDQNSISQLISDPVNHADNLMNDVAPIMNQYGFSDLNMDIEGTGFASPSAQLNYQQFISEVHKQIFAKNLNTSLSIDIIPVDFIRNDHLTIPANLAGLVDKIILMAYDFHSPSSFVTGPVAPLYGAGTVAEFDTQWALDSALKIFPPGKILLGAPLYGYSWETIDNFERSAIIPGTAVIVSNKDVEDLLANCATCSAQFDNDAKEHYIIYKNTDTGTFQQIFYPDADSLQAKVNFANANNLGGIALWALGYEGNTILNLLKK